MGWRRRYQSDSVARRQLRALHEKYAGLLGSLALLLLLLLGPTAGSAGAIPADATGAPEVSRDAVISQLYATGGASDAAWKNDFIELFNRGERSVDLSGWSLQYASAGGSDWQVTQLTGTLKPGRYYLVAEAGANEAVGAELPTPDRAGSIDLSAEAGQVALVDGQAPLACDAELEACFAASGVHDFLAYGPAGGTHAGLAPARAPAPGEALLRLAAGCADSDDNGVDFVAAPPTPHGSTAPAHPCRPPALRALAAPPTFKLPRYRPSQTRARARWHGNTQRSRLRVRGPANTSATHVCGHITSDTTWSPVGSPYILDCRIDVDAGATLTIQPGVWVEFAGTDPLNVNGALRSEGTAQAPVLFTAASDSNVCASFTLSVFLSFSPSCLHFRQRLTNATRSHAHRHP